MNTFELGFTSDYSIVENCTIDYIYTKDGGEYNIISNDNNASLQSIPINECVNSLDCIRHIIEWIKSIYNTSGTTVMVNATFTEEAEQGLNTDLSDEFFFDELENNNSVDDFISNYMHLSKDNFNEIDDFYKESERLWNKWNNNIKVHIFNIYHIKP